MIRNLSQSSKGQTVARSRVPSPILNIPIINPRVPRSKAARPLIPIADQLPSSAQERDATGLEGIEDLEESPKSKARAKAATTRAGADDPRAFSREETAMITTVINEFIRHEMERIKTNNLDLQEDYLTDTLDEQDGLQKELKNILSETNPNLLNCSTGLKK